MHGLKSLRGQSHAAAIILVCVLLLLSGVGVFSLFNESALLDELNTQIEAETGKVDPLLMTTKDIRNDVVQVQQWLSDISATRGLDGLSDGFDLAAQYAEKFDKHVTLATELATVLGFQDIVTALGELKTAFDPYYTVGKKMAEAYVADGPFGGNPMMGEFDGHAEKINGEIAKLTKLVDEARKKSAEDMVAKMHEAQSTGTTMMILTLVVFFIGLAVTAVVAFRMLKIANIISGASHVLARAKDGDLNSRVLDITAQDESGEMQRNVNRVLDRMEAYTRETMDAMRAVSEGQYWRKILTKGMVGDIGICTREVNRAIESMGAKVAAEKVAEAELTRMVSVIAAGNFSERLSKEGKSGFFLSLTEGINTIAESVQSGVDELSRVMEAMADGDLTVSMQGEFQGVFDLLKNDTNTMAERLKGIVQDIRSSTDTVNTASAEIAQGSGDLAGRTEQQASNLEETAAAMEELTATVRMNADNSKQASQLSTSARDAAERGGEVVSNAVSAMSKIEQSSSKISDIVSLIDEIAFQTNLLALNAAVEAARAGDAGKGFAVVAQEVRALAQRSSAASREIKDLISHSGQQVKEGVKLVNQAGETLHEIVTGVKKVADIVSEISSASQEQASGLNEINTAVSNMDEMTQQNAALVEETTAAAQSLEDQSKGLTRMVAFFNTGDGGGKITLPPGFAAPAPAPLHRPTAQAHVHHAPAAARPAMKSAPAPMETGSDDSDWQEF